LNRWLSIGLLTVLIGLLAGGLFWYLAYGVAHRPPHRLALEGITDLVRVSWQPERVVAIDAVTEIDAWAGLGFAHGIDRGWTVTLWRQAALGRMAEWFGDAMLPLDATARRLRLAALAMEAFETLPVEDQEILNAYARGMNAALGSRAVRLRGTAALLNLELEPWLPWHGLAIERLHAWLALTPPPRDRLHDMPDDVRSFLNDVSTLRRWLHLHGFEHSVAWALQDTAGAHLYQRHVFGSTAVPFFHESVVRWGDEAEISGASIPGTLFFPAGRRDNRAWSVLRADSMHLVLIVPDTLIIGNVYDRIVTDEGREHLLHTRTYPGGLLFDPLPLARDTLSGLDTVTASPAPAQAPSAWILSWSGLEPVTDWFAWRGLITGEPAAFQMTSGHGLLLGFDGNWSVLGQPPVSVAIRGGHLVGSSTWARYVALALDSLQAHDRTVGFQATLQSYYSVWAAQEASVWIASVDSVPRHAAPVQEALTYLRNWDYAYDGASIAASIFDTWLTNYRDSTGIMPGTTDVEATYFENLRRYQLLARAVADLSERFGPDSPDQRYFPVWSADTLRRVRGNAVAATRYAPISLAGRGHFSSPFWGPSPLLANPPATAFWEGWVGTGTWDLPMFRRRIVELDRFLGRYRIPDRAPEPGSIAVDEMPVHVTLLLPP
jgi:penicillin G amidase